MRIQSINGSSPQKAFSGQKKDDSPHKINVDTGNLPAPSYAYMPWERRRYLNTKMFLDIEKAKQELDDKIAKDPILRTRTQAVSQKTSQNEVSDPFLQRAESIRRNQAKALDMEKIKSIILPPAVSSELRSFEDSDKKFILDKYQKEAIFSFISGKNTIVTAPTGTGKTLIAEYGIDDALKRGERIIYLSPLKALSNEKFTKFSELFGRYDKDGNFINSDNVGIITGDVTINPDAQLLVMTTEIYRNMVNMSDPETTAEVFGDFSGVIYDEFHYLKDPDRGTVWEESVMQTPKHMRQMMLSATASNAKEISKWLNQVSPDNGTKLVDVPENERYVPLKEYVFGYKPQEGYYIEQMYDKKISLDYLKTQKGDRVKETIGELEKLYNGKNYLEILEGYANGNDIINAERFSEILEREKGVKHEKAQQMAYVLSDPSKNQRRDIRLSYAPKNPPLPPLVKLLNDKDKTPALFFVFSKKKCKKALDETSSQLGTLLTPEQSKRVLDVVKEAKDKDIYLGDDFDGEYLPKLLMGYAVHHAGMLPAYKSLVEKLSREGLVKACFATETLLAGINMPFKTTVFTSLEKFDGRKMIEIPPTNYKQGAGRAGRRGIDDLGNVIVCPKSDKELSRFKAIIESDDTKISSSFNLSYATLLQNSTLNNLDEFLKDSFFAYQSGSTQKIKKEARRKLGYLREKGYLYYENGKNHLTYKGEMAKNVYGINQILFCELMDNPDYTKNLTPEELAALMVMFADVKDDRPRDTFEDDMADIAQKLSPAIDLAKQIQKEQSQKKINEEIKMSTNLVPAILKFAYMPNINDEDCLALWQEIFGDLKSKYVIMHEGDLLRVFNGTIDLLRTIAEVSDIPELQKKADDAIKCLKKPPVTDILKYELDI